MLPAVSIIVPTYNRLEYLRRTLASVFQQTFRDWELLIADDGSDGDTRAYLQTLEDPPRVKTLWLPHSGRPSVARNAALRVARGEYVAFIDSDDLWTPSKLEIQIDSLRRRVDCRWGYTRFVLLDVSGTPTEWQRTHSWPTPAGWVRDRVARSETVIAVPSVIVSRELLEQVGGFDESLVMCEDFDLWLRLAARSPVDAIDEPCTLVTRHALHSGNALTSFEDCERVFEKLRRAQGTEHLHAALREQSAELTLGIARSHLAAGNRSRAFGTLLRSAPRFWRYPRWWIGVLRTTGRALAPAALIELVRRRRTGAHAARRAPQA